MCRMAASVSGSSGVTAEELAPRQCAQYTAPPRGENHGSSGSAAPHCAQQDRSGS